MVDITQGSTTVRSFVYDAAGNMTSDNRLGSTYAYTYNAANRLKTVSYEGNLRGTYTYNGRSQLAIRTISNMGTGIDGTIHTVHDLWGNVIAEADTTGQTVREYLWIPEVGHAGVSLPIAVIDNVDTTTPVTYYVHTDHLSRPILMTDGAKATVWQAEWSPWGAPHSITASPEMNQRFPGQWFQLEAGLHYNWHRHYDPSLGRYTQPDPLGFIAGPSVYAYAHNDPLYFIDPDGQNPLAIIVGAGAAAGRCALNQTCRRAVAEACSRFAKRFLKDESGELKGPSGKPKIHIKRHATRKRAKDAARNEGNEKPISHPSPQKGNRHFHPSRNGQKPRGGTHHEY